MSTDLPQGNRGVHDIVGSRVLVGTQMVDISRLSTHPIPLISQGLITVAGQGPTDSNGAGKSSFIAGLSLLHADARITNSALAEELDIAASTCHGRVRRLLESGVIRGFYADIDPVAVGLPLQAMISVSLQSNARGKIRDFIAQIRRRPQVMDVYFLAGADDFILHVAARDTEDLRSFVVENLNADADVAGTQTSLIFEHLRGAAPI